MRKKKENDGRENDKRDTHNRRQEKGKLRK